jgi:membrane dipeptidase
MAEITGVDHVSIGTDQHVSPGACRITRNGFTSSRRSCAVTPEEAGKIAGGNYMRIFRDAVG